MGCLRLHRFVLALTSGAVVAFLAFVVAPPVGAQEPGPDDGTVAETPEEPVPTETVPDETVPEATVPGEDATGDDTDDGTPAWVLAVILALVAVAVLGLVGQMLRSGRRSAPSRPADGGRRRPADDRAVAERHRDDDRLRRALGGAEWAHDQLTVEILAGGTRSPEMLQRSWTESRRRLNDLGAEIHALALDHEPATATDLQNLGHVVGLLIGAIDTNVDLRITQATSGDQVADALRASTAAVETRRAELAAAVARVRRHL